MQGPARWDNPALQDDIDADDLRSYRVFGEDESFVSDDSWYEVTNSPYRAATAQAAADAWLADRLAVRKEVFREAIIADRIMVIGPAQTEDDDEGPVQFFKSQTEPKMVRA